MKRLYTWTFLALLVIYILLVFILPADPQTLSKYNLTEFQVRLMNLSFVIPISLIYLAAMYGYIRVDNYANKISSTKEGPLFKYIAVGLGVQAMSLPIASLFGSARSYARYAQPDLVPSLSVVRNYVTLAFVIVAFLFVAKGSQGLYMTLNRRKTEKDPQQSYYWLIVPILLACVYTWLIVAQGYNTPGDDPFYIPEWLVVTTIVAPYVFIWCIGIRAVLYLRSYLKNVKGLIYKRALNFIAIGIAFIIVISMFIQAITPLAGVLSRLDLTPVLAIIYFLLALYAVGYGLVARGAKKLKQIEEA